MKFRLMVLSIAVLFVFCAIFYSAISSENEQAEQKVTKLPRWITEEKIRAGYLYAKDDTKYAVLMRSHGLNTVMVKGEFQFKEKVADTLEDCRQWAQAGKLNNLYVITAFNWGPYPEKHNYKPIFRSLNHVCDSRNSLFK